MSDTSEMVHLVRQVPEATTTQKPHRMRMKRLNRTQPDPGSAASGPPAGSAASGYETIQQSCSKTQIQLMLLKLHMIWIQSGSPPASHAHTTTHQKNPNKPNKTVISHSSSMKLTAVSALIDFHGWLLSFFMCSSKLPQRNEENLMLFKHYGSIYGSTSIHIHIYTINT